MLCGDLNRKEIQGRGDTGIRVADSLCCTAETLCEKLQQTVGEGLEYWFLTGEDLPPNDKAISGDTFGFHNLRQGELLLAANG